MVLSTSLGEEKLCAIRSIMQYGCRLGCYIMPNLEKRDNKRDRVIVTYKLNLRCWPFGIDKNLQVHILVLGTS